MMSAPLAGPPPVLRAEPDRGSLVLGIDIGGTKTAVLVGDRNARVLARDVFPSEAERGVEPMLAGIEEHVARALAAHEGVGAIGVAIGGPLDAEAGVVLGPPNLPGWDHVPLRAILEERFHLPVVVEHDAKAGAVAEWLFGAGKGARDLVFLTAGTGLGAGMILGGRLHRGARDAAGELGHWRIASDGPLVYGKRGSFEGLASGAGIAALARERFPRTFQGGVTAAIVADRARAGDPAARAVIEESGCALGRGLALLVDLLAPDTIVLGSLAVRLGELWLGPARAVVLDEALPALAARCRIVPSALGEALGDVAALAVAIHRESRGA
jgi:glucokinase